MWKQLLHSLVILSVTLWLSYYFELFFQFFRMNSAINQTQFLAVKFYESLQIMAACVAFLEMLNEDTFKLRLLINTAMMLHKGKQLLDKQMEPQEIHYYVGNLT